MVKHSALAKTYMSHNAVPQEKMLHRLVFIGLSAHHEFQEELMTGTDIPLYCAAFLEILRYCYILPYNKSMFVLQENISSKDLLLVRQTRWEETS